MFDTAVIWGLDRGVKDIPSWRPAGSSGEVVASSYLLRSAIIDDARDCPDGSDSFRFPVIA